MEKKDVLERTNYGLDIYAYVLRKYYPGETVLKMSGNECLPARNPFNGNKETLVIRVQDNIATHVDIENGIAPGNAFDFARLMMPMEENELLSMLNKVMYLRLEPQVEPEQEKPPVDDHYPLFSLFNKPLSNTRPSSIVNLPYVYNIIKGDGYRFATQALRKITEPDKFRRYKTTHFDYATFSGIFAIRNNEALISHSGLLTIDFDHVEDLTGLKQALLNDKYFFTELMFVSPSGNGLKWIIPITTSDYSHLDYFRGVAAYIQKAYDLKIDTCGREVSRACLLCHDPDVYINPVYLNC